MSPKDLAEALVQQAGIVPLGRARVVLSLDGPRCRRIQRIELVQAARGSVELLVEVELEVPVEVSSEVA